VNGSEFAQARWPGSRTESGEIGIVEEWKINRRSDGKSGNPEVYKIETLQGIA